jgi:hypothetical protein
MFRLNLAELGLTSNRWFFAVTATGDYGLESDYSNELAIGGYFPRTNVLVYVGIQSGANQLTNILALSLTNTPGNGLFMSRISQGPPGLASLDLLKDSDSGWKPVTNFLMTIVATTNKTLPTINIISK